VCLEFQSGTLNTHMRLHTGDKKYKCHMCDKAFSQSGNLNKHVRVYTGDKPYKCSLCDRSFSQSSHLQSHKRHVHSNRRSSDCPYCANVAVRYCEPHRMSHLEEASLHPGLYKRLRAVVAREF